ncbi:hypothetical protein [Sphingobacterium paludis]|jgi:hypothetical protein|uniref:Uncharacterized protein n=1 Tax=Sphingobacterium paludis TaxID=1476465 RepID=A0A4R7D380_9SPHI|nr:hypothetical protein [Sphingobacterium paludis]TDS14075.1 hypothetical protein B0I21_104404 [Sphingobacterium paludis]
MVEYFTQDEHETGLSEKNVAMVDNNTDAAFDETLRHGLAKLAKSPSAKTIEHILNYSKSLTK